MKIIGNTVGTSLPKPNMMQEDPRKGDYVKGKEEFLPEAIKRALEIDKTLTVAGAAADAAAVGEKVSKLSEEIDELTKPMDAASGQIVQIATDESSTVVVESAAEVLHAGRNLFEVGSSKDDDYIKNVYLLSVDPSTQTMSMRMSADSYTHAIRGNKIPFKKGMSIHIAAECVDADADPIVPILSLKTTDGIDLTSGVNGRYIAAYGGFIPTNFGDAIPPSSYTFVCEEETAAYCYIGVNLRSSRGIDNGVELNVRIMAEIENPTGIWEAGFLRSYTPANNLVEIQTISGVNNFYASNQSEVIVISGTSQFVQSVNGKRGVVALGAKDVGAVSASKHAEFVYNTVDDMLRDKDLPVGKCARTLGYYAKNDGGGATYTVDDVDDGYGFACANGYCNIVVEKYMSPKMFGAIGNGDYEYGDDTEAFQACMDFCANRCVVDISDGCYVIAGVKLYHGKVYDISGSHRQGLTLGGYNKLHGSILVKHGAEVGFVGSDELGTDSQTGLPCLTLNLYNVRANGYYHGNFGNFPTLIKGVLLSMSRIDNINACNLGCFFDGIMKGACIVSNCYFTVSDAAFRSHYIVNGEYYNGFVDCYFYSNLFMGIMKWSGNTLFKPVAFETWGFYTIQITSNFFGGMWAIVGCKRLSDDTTVSEFVGWSSRDNVYSFVKEFATPKDDSEHIITGNIKIFGDQLWNCSFESLANTTEGRSYFTDVVGNLRISGDRTPFFNFQKINLGTIRDLVMRYTDPVFPDEIGLRKVTINNPVYLTAPNGHDFSESEHAFDTKFLLTDFVGNSELYKYTHIDSWSDRVVDALPVIQDDNYRYVLEGQTCYFRNKLLTCRGDSWYDAMGNVVMT